MTARWVGAAEGLALGLVNRIDNDPDQAAGELAATLADLGPGAPQKIKTVMSADGPGRPAARRAAGEPGGVGSDDRRGR